MHLRLAALITLGFLGSVAYAGDDPQPAPPPNAKQQEADRLFAEGRDLLLQKKPKEACEKFEAANQLDPLAAGTKLNLGLCYEELGKYHTALKWFREAQARASESNLPDHEAAAKQHTQDLAAKVPAVTIEFDVPVPSDPQVSIDGEMIAAGNFGHVEVDPGHHVLVAKATGKRLARQEFDIAEKTTKNLHISMVDGDATIVLDPGKPRRYAAYGLVVVGVALWVVTLKYGLDKKDDYNKETAIAHEMGDPDNDPMTATHSQTERDEARVHANQHVKDLKIYGSTMFAIGAAAIGGAALLYFTAPERRSVEATAFAPYVTNDQVGFAIGGHF